MKPMKRPEVYKWRIRCGDDYCEDHNWLVMAKTPRAALKKCGISTADYEIGRRNLYPTGKNKDDVTMIIAIPLSNRGHGSLYLRTEAI